MLGWDFKQKLVGRTQEPWMYSLYVDNMLRVCNEDYCSHPVITVGVFEHLLPSDKEFSSLSQSDKRHLYCL